MARNALGLGILALLLALPPALAADDDPRPWAEQPFLGLSVRDTPEGLIVSWVSPGPLGGLGFESATGVQRGDRVLSVDGVTVDADAFQTLVKAKAPGDVVQLSLRHDAGGEAFDVEATLASRDEWAGQVGRGLGHRAIPPARAGELEALVLEAAAEAGVRDGVPEVGGGLDALLAHLEAVQSKALDPSSLPSVVQCFERPLSVDAVEAQIYDAVRAAASGDLAAVEVLIRRVLDLPDPDDTILEVMGAPWFDLTDVERAEMGRFAGQYLEEYQGVRGWRAPVEALLSTLREGVYLYDENAVDHVRTINTIAAPRAENVLTLVLSLLRIAPALWQRIGASHAHDDVLEALPKGLQDLVTGDLLFCAQGRSGHWVVVGGPGDNAYDMGKIAAVYDVGGDDTYHYDDGGRANPVATRLVVDLAGDDTHESMSAFEGPATAVFGLSLIDDRAGNDAYRTFHPFGVAAGLMGVGILIDRAGDDIYESVGVDSGWGIGAGFWGAGLVIDRAGHDVYRGEKYVQGVGGPRGVGMIIDSAGRDLYEANGPSNGSAYGTPAVYVGMSQGFGFGVRGYAAGGLGAIYDLGGNDRYEAGEFSQAGGYYFGLGILHDAKGHDLYYGNRYGQAFAAHQAIGILVDDEGDDTYWSMTAASQAGTWDESIGLLLDRQGNDAYRCDGLGQGGASMQAIAILADLQGDDRYSGAGASVQGQGGGNRYHYDRTKVFSFSALLDLGGGRDAYSSGRANDTLTPTGAYREEKPEDSNLYGLHFDR